MAMAGDEKPVGHDDEVQNALQELVNHSSMGKFVKIWLITTGGISAIISGAIGISELTDDDSYINMDIHGYINGVELDEALKSMSVDYKALLRQITEEEISRQAKQSSVSKDQNDAFFAPGGTINTGMDVGDAFWFDSFSYDITFQIGDDFRQAIRKMPENHGRDVVTSIHSRVREIVSDHITSNFNHEAVFQKTEDQALLFRAADPEQVWTQLTPDNS